MTHPPSQDVDEAHPPTGNEAAAPPHHAMDYSEQPLIVTWEATQACELACDHCRADAEPDRDPAELTTEEGKRLLDQVASFGSPSPIFVVSGGDPLERPDLFELLEYARSIGVRTAVTPAPTAALTREVVERLEAAGVRRIALSLDGATAASHDGFRGEEGSFETVRSAAAYAADVGLDIQINTTVTATTVGELPGIADLVAELDAVVWEVFFLVPIGRGVDLDQLDPDQAEATLEWLYRRQQTAPFRVITVEAPHYRRVASRVASESGLAPPQVGTTGDGDGFVFVSHTGEIFPSGFLPEGAGTVPAADLVEVYRDADLFRSLRDPEQRTGVCGACNWRDRCGGSRARARATTGNPLGPDPLCGFEPSEAPAPEASPDRP
jgi:MoaA/NifB/PqqE/SkfB family radical SAM enzyme